MLRALTDKVDSRQGEMHSGGREMKMLRQNQEEMLEIKTTVTNAKNAFDGFIRRRGMLRKVSELGDVSVEISRTESEEDKD